MGLMDFLRDTGKDLFGGKSGNEAESIKREIDRALGQNIQGLGVTFNNGTVTLQGQAKSQAAKEKAALVAGNVRGVERVNADAVTVSGGAAPAATGGGMAKAAPAKDAGGRYYTIQKGDTLSEIAQRTYGEASKWRALFDANKEVIEDPDKIYPGQQIRIPADLSA